MQQFQTPFLPVRDIGNEIVSSENGGASYVLKYLLKWSEPYFSVMYYVP